MPGICNSVPMAECLNRGLGLANNDDMKQAIIPGPIIADIVFRDLCHNDGNHRDYSPLSQNNQKNILMSPSSSTSTSEEELYAEAVDLQKNCDTKIQSVNEKTNSILICQDSTNELLVADTENVVTENISVRPKVPYSDSIYFLPVNYNQRNPWRRMIGLQASGDILKNATYPLKSRARKQRFAQAKKPLSYLYSYFSVKILEYKDKCGITIGLSRKDYPSKMAPGQAPGSLGYCSDSGSLIVRDATMLNGPEYSEGDVIGCGIIYPSHYKRYADLSTDDNSDGMSDVVLTSLLNINKKSMDFVKNVLNLNVKGNTMSSSETDSSDDEFGDSKQKQVEEQCDYYNENYVESRTQVEVYFTHNMKVVGKVLSHIPVGGFYPTVHIFSSCALKMSVDLNPPTS